MSGQRAVKVLSCCHHLGWRGDGKAGINNKPHDKHHVSRYGDEKKIQLAVGHNQKVDAQVSRSKSDVRECSIHGSI